jgi:peptidyl-prolyl cis-trans isomerase SurA
VEDVRGKLTIDALWNELIILKYSSKIKIDEDKIRKKIINKGKNESIEYNLSEIVYETSDKQNIKEKYLEIKNSIDEIGFENSASIYSISKSSKIGGDIGWIRQESLNPTIMKNISKLSINEITNPIIISNGVLILKINETKKILTEINLEEELRKLINYERNEKLDQYSKIYFNKVKKNIGFNE